MSCDAYLALGSNMGDRERNLIKAIEGIQCIKNTQLQFISNIYETDPVGYTDQERFLNMVIAIRTTLEPLELLDELQYIENSMGRTRDVRWGPRPIDIDILLYEDLTFSHPRLCIPHPRMFERAFVLVPLNDVYKCKKNNNFDIDVLINKCDDKDGVKLFKVTI